MFRFTRYLASYYTKLISPPSLCSLPALPPPCSLLPISMVPTRISNNSFCVLWVFPDDVFHG